MDKRKKIFLCFALILINALFAIALLQTASPFTHEGGVLTSELIKGFGLFIADVLISFVVITWGVLRK